VRTLLFRSDAPRDRALVRDPEDEAALALQQHESSSRKPKGNIRQGCLRPVTPRGARGADEVEWDRITRHEASPPTRRVVRAAAARGAEPSRRSPGAGPRAAHPRSALDD